MFFSLRQALTDIIIVTQSLSKCEVLLTIKTSSLRHAHASTPLSMTLIYRTDLPIGLSKGWDGFCFYICSKQLTPHSGRLNPSIIREGLV